MSVVSVCCLSFYSSLLMLSLKHVPMPIASEFHRLPLVVSPVDPSLPCLHFYIQLVVGCLSIKKRGIHPFQAQLLTDVHLSSHACTDACMSLSLFPHVFTFVSFRS